MAMMGIEGKVYYDASGVGGSTWTLLDIVGEVTGDDSRTEGQIKLRGRDNVLYAVGMRDRPVTLQLLYDPSNTGYAALLAAYAAKTTMGFAFLDTLVATATATDGWEGDYLIASWGQPQPVDDVWMVDVRLVPSAEAGATAPQPFTPGI